MLSFSSLFSDFYACLFIICSYAICAQSDVPRPRGVSLAKAPLYQPGKDFTCFDGTLTIAFSFVNDDYCDCFDGSDEPGTAACLNGVFHCTNAGYRSANIPSSRVNDGVCDCCDGTDEYATQEGCPNICEELGKEARYEAQRLAELHRAGNSYRLELIEKGNSKRSEMAEQLSQLEKDKAEADKIKEEKQAIKTDLETKENEALNIYRLADEEQRQKEADAEKEQMIQEAKEFFDKYDINSDGVLSKEEIKDIKILDRDQNGEVDDDDFNYFFNEKDSADKETFVFTTWSMIKPFLVVEQNTDEAPAPADEAPAPATEAEEEEHDDLELEEDAYDNSKEIDTEGENDNADVELNEDGDGQEEHVEEKDLKSKYDEDTVNLINAASAARKALVEAETTVREIEANIKRIQENLEKDYGLQQEYATMDGQCYEFEDKEYIYKLCLFQKVTQKSKNGGGEVGLGNWGEWAGPDDNKYSAMKYTGGVSCWNGPQRMTTVEIQCGLETKLLSVTEPFRCEYKMELSTPAACDELSIQQHVEHDEL